MGGEITRAIVEAYVRCRYKAYLLLEGHAGDESEYGALRAAAQAVVRHRAIAELERVHGPGGIARGEALTVEVLRCGRPALLDVLGGPGGVLAIDGLQRVPGESALGAFHYIPLLFAEGPRVRPEHRLLVELFAQLLAPAQGLLPGRGVVWHGAGSPSTIKLSDDARRARRALVELGQLRAGGAPPSLVLNEHCALCAFRRRCHEQAVQEDSLSLLRGLVPKEIARYARKGILTLTQLAHTFRPRRSRKPATAQKKRHYALQAMAIRDRRIYVIGAPVVPDGPVQIYLDVESEPDAGFVYLIGLLVVEGGRETRRSFWADTRDDEVTIFERLVDTVVSHPAFQLFCYGSLEREYLARMRKRSARPELVERMLAALINTLSLVYAHLYFPTYSNGLKDVGHCIGARWGAPDASGLQSIVWRARWAAGGGEEWWSQTSTPSMTGSTAHSRSAWST